MPFGWSNEESLKKGNNQFLSANNALADMSQLIKVVKEKYQAQDSPVIAFGGSYGGMLASWMRIKYPD